jgi:hypothetical protein
LNSSITLDITEVATKYLNNFRAALYYSKLTSEIDAVDDSIVSNQTDLFVYKRLNPALDRPQNLVIDFNIPLKKTYYVLDKVSSGRQLTQGDIESSHSVHSSLIIYNGTKCELEDNCAGIVRLVKKQQNEHVVIKNVGTVDYDTGRILLNNFSLDSYEGNYFKIFVTPKNKDIVINKNEILYIESSDINLNIEAVRN